MRSRSLNEVDNAAARARCRAELSGELTAVDAVPQRVASSARATDDAAQSLRQVGGRGFAGGDRRSFGGGARGSASNPGLPTYTVARSGRIAVSPAGVPMYADEDSARLGLSRRLFAGRATAAAVQHLHLGQPTSPRAARRSGAPTPPRRRRWSRRYGEPPDSKAARAVSRSHTQTAASVRERALVQMRDDRRSLWSNRGVS